jgi:hypothetical protein
VNLKSVPKPPEPPPTGLDEVERAISVLEGRHPEHERTKRETMAAVEERRHVLEAELAASARRRRRRTLVIAANAVALIAAGFVTWRVVTRARAIRATLDVAERPFVAAGLEEIASNEVAARSTLEADTPASGCFVAVGTDGHVRARAANVVVEGDGSVGWCSCQPEHVTVEALSGGGGLALLHVDARAVGGPLARPWAKFTPAEWGRGATECADAMLDAWIGDGHGPRTPIEASWLDTTAERASLKKAGFRFASAVDEARPFGVVEGAAGDCLLAIASDDDVLSLRATGGARRIVGAKGAIAWCNSAGETTTVWREGGTAAVVVLAAPAARVGGLLGVRECAAIARVYVPADRTWLRDEDLAWDATSVLRASALGGVVAGPLPQEPSGTKTRLSAVAWAAGAKVDWDPSGAVVACDPRFDTASTERESVCASTEPVLWWRKNEVAAAAATAPLPFWLSSLEARREPDAVATVPQLLSVARRLVRAGFEPSVLEGVTELPDGVRVVGRAGEDAVVAVGLGPKPPWAFPYTDGVPWDLGDQPRVVALQPGVAVKLVATPPQSAPIEKRRTVVFRHAVRAAH